MLYLLEQNIGYVEKKGIGHPIILRDRKTKYPVLHGLQSAQVLAYIDF